MMGWLPLITASNTDAAQTTAFLARTSGLSGTETLAYRNLINGLVSDGTFSTLDCLYIFATNTTTTANLNLVSTNFTLTPNGSVTFTADQGYTGNGTTGYLDTNYIYGSNLFSLNSGGLGGYVLTNRSTTNKSYVVVGRGENTSQTTYNYIAPQNNNAGFQSTITGTSGPGSAIQNNSQGLWIVSRTASNLTSAYLNGNTTAFATSNSTSFSATPTLSFLILAAGFGTVGAPSNFSADLTSAAFIGSGWSSVTQSLIAGRINSYMTALGINVY